VGRPNCHPPPSSPQRIAPLDGTIVGVVDVVDMARRAGVAGRTFTVVGLCR
jgi:hypothetical protein